MSLELKHISKHFGGVQALTDVSVAFYPGQVNALVGENGAGKSTLMKILSGVYVDYEGEVWLNGTLQQFKGTKDAEAAGIAIIHQELNLVPELSIADNLFLGKEKINDWGWLDRPFMNKKSREVMDRLDLRLDPSVLVSELKVGQCQLVEIAKALLSDASVLVMDEPTSAISDAEVTKLFTIIRQLRSEGKTIIYISHKMKELFELSDCFVVLRDGRHVASESASGITEELLITQMAGRKLETRAALAKSFGETALELQGLCLNDAISKAILKDISFSVRKGEVLGIYGLLGAGRTELMETLFGLHKTPTSKKIEIAGRTYFPTSPKAAMDAGLALVPEDRKVQGLLLDWSLIHNISLPNLQEFVSDWHWINTTEEHQKAQSGMQQLGVKAKSADQPASSLSGGNQQKLVLAKWLATCPVVLLLDEPTRGVDVNAKQEIYRLIQELAAEGMAILVASSEIPEIMALSDTVMVMCEGTVSGIMSVDQANETQLLTLALPK